MSWKRRLVELTLAGGMLSGCGDFFACNGNSDPCCRDPRSQACDAYKHRDLAPPPEPAGDLGRPDLEPPRD